MPVAKAWLAITTGNESANAPSNGVWSVHSVLRSWDSTSLHSSFGSTPGLQVDDGDISEALDSKTFINGSQVWFDVTDYLEGVRSGQTDNGIAVLTKMTGDGWQIHLNGSPDAQARPLLHVISGNVAIVVPELTGDYNSNGVVDAADYVTWRNNLNQSVTLPNDSTPGTVTTADYNVWRANFGKTADVGGPLGSGAAVPEPATLLLVTLAAFWALGNRRSRC
jgi:hypothetical protein